MSDNICLNVQDPSLYLRIQEVAVSVTPVYLESLIDVSTGGKTVNQVLTWKGTYWEAADASAGGEYDASINFLYAWNTTQDGSINALFAADLVQDGSINALFAEDLRIDGSLNALFAEDLRQDGSISALYVEDIRLDGSISALWNDLGNKMPLVESPSNVYTSWIGALYDTDVDWGVWMYGNVNPIFRIHNQHTVPDKDPEMSIQGNYPVFIIKDNGALGSRTLKIDSDSYVDTNYYNRTYLDGSISALFVENDAQDTSINWLNINKLGLDTSISDLSDVSLGGIAAAQDGSALVYNSDGYWEYGVAGGGSGGESYFADLLDVSITSRVSGDLAQYNNDSSTWDNVTPIDISTLALDASVYFWPRTTALMQEASLGPVFVYSDASWGVNISSAQDPSISALYGDVGDLQTEDLRLDGSITALYVEDIRLDGSITYLFDNPGVANFYDLNDVSVSSRANYDSLIYNSDTSTWDNIATVDISALYYSQTYLDASFAQVYAAMPDVDGSLTALYAEDLRQDGSITALFTEDLRLDGSITALFTEDLRLDGSITWLFENTTGSLADLSDTSVYSAAIGDLIQITDGSIWENVTPIDISTLALDASDYFSLKSNDTYGQLYIHDASLVKSIPTGATYIPLGPWTVSDISANMTYDPSRYFMKPQRTGKYQVSAHLSFATDTNSVTTRGAIFQGGVEKNWLHFADFRGVGADIIQSSSITGILDVSTLDTSIGLRIKHDNGGTIIYTIYYANMNVHRIGD